MRFHILLLCTIISACCPHLANSTSNDKCEHAVRKVMEEMWTGVQPNESIDKAIKFCLVTANKGDVIAQYHLSMLYTLKNNKKENDKTYEWTLKAANNGHPESQFYLGNMYEKGIVVEQNIEKAYQWYKKAAKNGFPLAQKKLEEKKGAESKEPNSQ